MLQLQHSYLVTVACFVYPVFTGLHPSYVSLNHYEPRTVNCAESRSTLNNYISWLVVICDFV